MAGGFLAQGGAAYPSYLLSFYQIHIPFYALFAQNFGEKPKQILASFPLSPGRTLCYNYKR